MTKRILLVFSCLVFMAGCVSKKTHVASPPDASHPAARPGQKPYTVLGKRYEPMASHEGFVQSGVASTGFV